MSKFLLTKFIITLGLIVALVLPSMSAMAVTAGFNPAIDGLVTNFGNYQTFGGKDGVAVKSVSYNVFLPTGMGFSPTSDVLEMLYSGPGGGQSIAYESNLPAEAGTCKASSNGYNCNVAWQFSSSDPAITQGTYTISFVVLNNNTMPVNGVYMNLLGNGSGQPLYAESGQIFINEPLTTPYASFTSSVQSLYTLVNPSSPQSITFAVDINTKNSPSEVDFYMDGQLVKDDTNYATVSDSSYVGGQVDQFTYTLNDLKSLSNGDHILTATALGAGYSVPVVTQSGQSQVNIESAYGSDQSCAIQISSINLITKNVISQETTEMNQIQTIDNQALNYFTKRPPSISDYSQLVSAVNNDNKNVYSDLALLVGDNSFQCSNIASQISMFITGLNKVYTDLGTYQTDSINLLTKAGGLSG